MRYAIKVAYIGSNYYGFQRQPSKPTVEEVLIEAMLKAGLISDLKNAGYRIAGRTDRGVHALSQVVSFKAKEPVYLPRINAFLPKDVRCWAYALVSDDFNPRRDAILRTYKYYVAWKGEDVELMREAALLLLGTHNFKNFCKPRKGESTVRTLQHVSVEEKGGVLCFTLSARSFLWMMARKIVSVLLMVGSNVKSIDFVESLLNPEFKPREGIKPVDPEGLILYDIKYPFEFVACEKSRKQFMSYLRERFYKSITASSVFNGLIKGLEASLP